MYTYACFFVTLRLAIGIYNAIVSRDIKQTSYPAIQFMGCLLHYAVYFLGRRFKDKFVPMIVIVYVTMYFLAVARMEVMANQGKDDDEMSLWIRGTVSVITAVTCLLLTPSVNYILFCYAPCALMTTVICIFRYSLERKQIIGIAAWVFASLILWYILQKRELKRFYEQ